MPILWLNLHVPVNKSMSESLEDLQNALFKGTKFDPSNYSPNSHQSCIGNIQCIWSDCF